MELNQLACFLQVAKTEHITQAAEQLHMTQPSVSKVISRLEEDLGVRLFDREGRNIRLNEQGRVVMRYAEQLLYTVGDMRAELQEVEAGEGGSIRIGSSYAGQEPNWLLTCVREFLLARPDVKFRLQTYPAESLPQALESREVDLAVAVCPLLGADIQWQELFVEPLGVIMAANHPLASRPELSLSDLRYERFYCNDVNSDSNEMTMRCCDLAGFQPDIHFSGLFSSLIGEAVSRGYGISMISELGFLRSRSRKSDAEWENNIIFRQLKEEYCCRVCGIAYLKSRRLPRAVEEFYQYLIDSVAKNGSGSAHASEK